MPNLLIRNTTGQIVAVMQPGQEPGYANHMPNFFVLSVDFAPVLNGPSFIDIESLPTVVRTEVATTGAASLSSVEAVPLRPPVQAFEIPPDEVLLQEIQRRQELQVLMRERGYIRSQIDNPIASAVNLDLPPEDAELAMQAAREESERRALQHAERIAELDSAITGKTGEISEAVRARERTRRG